MTETKSFSLPEEIADQIERYAAVTRLNKSTIATMAFEDFLNKPEVRAKIEPSPSPALTTEAQ